MRRVSRVVGEIAARTRRPEDGRRVAQKRHQLRALSAPRTPENCNGPRKKRTCRQICGIRHRVTLLSPYHIVQYQYLEIFSRANCARLARSTRAACSRRASSLKANTSFLSAALRRMLERNRAEAAMQLRRRLSSGRLRCGGTRRRKQRTRGNQRTVLAAVCRACLPVLASDRQKDIASQQEELAKVAREGSTRRMVDSGAGAWSTMRSRKPSKRILVHEGKALLTLHILLRLSTHTCFGLAHTRATRNKPPGNLLGVLPLGA